MVTTSVYKWMLAAIFRFGITPTSASMHFTSRLEGEHQLDYNIQVDMSRFKKKGSNLQRTPTVFYCIYHSSSKHNFKSKGENPTLTYIITQSFNKAVMGIFNTHQPYENICRLSQKTPRTGIRAQIRFYALHEKN